MKKLKAEGAIGLLLGLLIISVIFIMMMPALRNVSGGAGINGSSIKQESVSSRLIRPLRKYRECVSKQ